MALLPGTILCAQPVHNQINLEAGSSIHSGTSLPFWLFSNQYSLLEHNAANFYLRTGYNRYFREDKNIDFSWGFNLVNRYSSDYSAYFEEGYGKAKIYFVQIQAGRVKEVFGNQDSVLSSGGLLWSGNSLPVPAVSISTPEYVPFPFSFGYIHFKAGISHGWFENNQYVKNALLHHKYISFKAGGDLPVNFSIALHHFAQWGGTSTDPIYGKLPSDLRAFRNIFFAKSGESDSPVNDQENAAGNHLGSYNLGADFKLKPVHISLYWQSVFEDNSGRTNQNLWDGLYGISVTNYKGNFLKRIVIEFLSTINQSGAPQPPDPEDPRYPTWNDNYFNNWLYKMGWSYYNMTMGTPLITSPVLSGDNNEHEQFNNNRINSLHTGITGKISAVEYTFFYTRSINKGTYRYPYSPARYQASVMLKILYPELFQDTDAAIAIGGDKGEMYGNNFGVRLSIIKKVKL